MTNNYEGEPMTNQLENPYKVHEVTNPEFKPEGDWYVDDGLQVVFFWDEGDAELYANDVWEYDRKQESA